MNREQLAHVLRAAARIAKDNEHRQFAFGLGKTRSPV